MSIDRIVNIQHPCNILTLEAQVDLHFNTVNESPYSCSHVTIMTLFPTNCERIPEFFLMLCTWGSCLMLIFSFFVLWERTCNNSREFWTFQVHDSSHVRLLQTKHGMKWRISLFCPSIMHIRTWCNATIHSKFMVSYYMLTFNMCNSGLKFHLSHLRKQASMVLRVCAWEMATWYKLHGLH